MKAFALALLVVAAMGVVGAVPAVAATATATGRDDVAPCQNGTPPAPGERCRGPVDNESGGGGSVLTIAVSVIVGLGIATVAFVVLRRQLASHRSPGTGTGGIGTSTGGTSTRGAGEQT
jgi:hypothetical protein